MEWINDAGNLLPVGILKLNLFIRFVSYNPFFFPLETFMETEGANKG